MMLLMAILILLGQKSGLANSTHDLKVVGSNLAQQLDGKGFNGMPESIPAPNVVTFNN